MDKDKEGWVEMKLFPVDKPLVSSDTYPAYVMTQAVQDLIKRRGFSMLEGECDTNYGGRFTTVDHDRVSHIIDPATLMVKDGYLVGMVKPTGRFAELAERFLHNQPTFAMRALVQYHEGNTTQTQNRTASHCDIISFDLVNPNQ